MIIVKKELCKACGLCVKNCPASAVKVIDKLAVVQENCVSCGVCVRVCPFQAIMREVEIAAGAVSCRSCPVQCEIKAGFEGACKRYSNINGKLVRNRELVLENTRSQVQSIPAAVRPPILSVRRSTASMW